MPCQELRPKPQHRPQAQQPSYQAPRFYLQEVT